MNHRTLLMTSVAACVLLGSAVLFAETSGSLNFARAREILRRFGGVTNALAGSHVRPPFRISFSLEATCMAVG